VEYLTDEIERQAESYLKKIDELGGALAAIEQGYIQGEIQEASYQYQRAVESQEEIVVGVNQFQVDEKIELERLKIDPFIEANQVARLKAYRSQRDAARVSELLTRLEDAARGNENLMPLFIEMVENNITLGEISKVLRGVWGEYQPPVF
jgi:methylmalonyl-CoA mutase, N-terminal domain